MSPSHWIPSATTTAAEAIDSGGNSLSSPPPVPLRQPQPQQTPRTYSYLSSAAFCVPIHPGLPAEAPVNDQGRHGGNGEAVSQRPPSNRPPRISPAERRRPDASLSLHRRHHKRQQQQPPERHQHAKLVKHKRRYCGVPGCKSIVKSQGVCQRHGAKPRKCRVETCAKQAQGNFGGMCKVHYKAHSRSAATAAAAALAVTALAANHDAAAPTGGQGATAPSALSSSEEEAEVRDSRERGIVSNSSNGAWRGEAEMTGSISWLLPDSRATTASASDALLASTSVYDSVLPASLAWRSEGPRRRGASEDPHRDEACSGAVATPVMPLVEYLSRRSGAHLARGWHRRQERRARGCPFVCVEEEGGGTASPPVPVEWDDWERELIWTELLLLTGAAAGGGDEDRPAMMDHLAHAWGCRPAFHSEFMSQWLGERQTVAPTVRRAESRDSEYDERENEADASEEEEEDGDLADVDDDDADYNDNEDPDVGMILSGGGPASVTGADAWDDACYTAHSYNEALASDLLFEHLSSSSPQHTPTATMDGILLMMEHQHEDSDEEDEDRVTDDASSSSSQGNTHCAHVSDE